MFQSTIKKKVSLAGKALHSGENVSLDILPAPENSGISFIRKDIKGDPSIKADLKNVTEIKRGTNLGCNKAKILTVEHVLSALYGLVITNAVIEMDGPEPPVLDGSSKDYVDAIRKAGIKKQNKKIKVIKIKNPILLNSGSAQIIAFPSDRFIVSFMINYPGVFVGSQVFTFDSKSNIYEKDIAPARTYGFMKEVEDLRRSGLIKGATFDNTIAITDTGYSTKLRFGNELVRHKILDLIGDMALTEHYICAHIIGIKSGHDLNIELAGKLVSLGGK